MSTFGQVKQLANFECQLKIYESLYFSRTYFIINVHVVKDWKISFIASERTIPLPKKTESHMPKPPFFDQFSYL